MKNPSLVNKTFGEYKLTKKLGAGAFGQIYKGIYKPTNEKRAVKIEPKSAKFP